MKSWKSLFIIKVIIFLRNTISYELFNLTALITKAFDEDNFAYGTLYDLPKAFDTIDRNILFKKSIIIQ